MLHRDMYDVIFFLHKKTCVLKTFDVSNKTKLINLPEQTIGHASKPQVLISLKL